MSLRWLSYVAPKHSREGEGAQKRKTAVFAVKSHFAWRKSATKFLNLCECQRQSCKAVIGLTNRAKIIEIVEIVDVRQLLIHNVVDSSGQEETAVNWNMAARKIPWVFTGFHANYAIMILICFRDVFRAKGIGPSISTIQQNAESICYTCLC